MTVSESVGFSKSGLDTNVNTYCDAETVQVKSFASFSSNVQVLEFIPESSASEIDTVSMAEPDPSSNSCIDWVVALEE